MDLRIGQKAQRTLRVTPEMVADYARITGDYNPLHFDEKFAARTRFGRLIAQGGITTGLLHALVAMDMPGQGTVFTGQNWQFPAPVYIGDTLDAEATVEMARNSRGIARLSFIVTNQDGTVVLTGEAGVYQAATSE